MRTSYCIAFVLLIAFAVAVTPRACLAWPDPCPDWPAPDVSDDGEYTSSTSELHASWTPTDKSEYWYAIGTSPGAEDVIGRTSTGTQTEVTRTGLSLTVGQTYYFTVQYYNSGEECYSAKGCSDGITVVDFSLSLIHI